MSASSSQSRILHLEPPPGARVRVISDMHLGHERCEAPPVAELAPLLEGVDILVVAGDLAEEQEEQGRALRDELHALCREHGVTLICVAGNHDPDAGPSLLSLWGGRVVIMHGHALYKQGSPWGWEYLRNKKLFHECIARFPGANSSLEERLELSSQICQLTVPILRREGIQNRYLRGLLHCFFPPMRPLSIVWCWLSCGRRAEAFARRFFPQAEVLVLGHFHRSGRWTYGRRTIVNTGAWFKHATPWLADLQDGHLVDYRKVPVSAPSAIKASMSRCTRSPGRIPSSIWFIT